MKTFKEVAYSIGVDFYVKDILKHGEELLEQSLQNEIEASS